VKKYVKDRCALVDVEMKGVNQRGQLTAWVRDRDAAFARYS
jgi:hypothetical protein